MMIDVEAGIYTCRLLENQDGTPMIGLAQHHAWNYEARTLGDETGGVQVLFGAQCFQKDESGNFVTKGECVLDTFGYTIVNPDTSAKNAGEPVEWKIRMLAEAFGISEAEVFSIDMLDPTLLKSAEFDVEVEEYQSKNGKTGKRVNRIGAVGAFAQPVRQPLQVSKNRALFNKYATLMNSKKGTQAKPVQAVATPQTPPPAATAPTAPKRAALPSRAEVAAAKGWDAAQLYEVWKQKQLGTDAEYFAAIDEAMGRSNVEPNDLSAQECEAVAQKLGFDLPF